MYGLKTMNTLNKTFLFTPQTLICDVESNTTKTKEYFLKND